MNDATRILVTRSGPEGQALAARLSARGASVSHYAPVRLAAPSDPSMLARELLAWLPADCLVVPSAAALRQLARLIRPSDLGATPIVVPGRGSAERGSALGFQNLVFPDQEGTSERMLDLPELSAVAGRRILILAAAGGRRLIEDSLRHRGAEVGRLHVYRRVPVEPGPKLLEELSAAADLVTLLASGGALAGLQARLPPSAWQTVAAHLAIAPSARVAELAEAAGCGRVGVAAGADDDSMLRALAQMRPDLRAMRYPLDWTRDNVEP